MRTVRSRFLMSLPRWEEGPLTRWPHVAIGGRSNVGKSSLINALLGRRGLARTSSTPGRTQTLNFFLVDEQFVVVDLPGYGYAKAPKDAARRWTRNSRGYIAGSRVLRGVVLLLDMRRDPSPEDLAFAGWVRSAGQPLVTVATKCDKVGRGQRTRRLKAIAQPLRVEPSEIIVTSSRTGEGRDPLWERVLGLIEAADGEKDQPRRLG